MVCCGDREKQEKISDTQKWDYINLSDFKSRSCFTPFSYFILYILLAISIACYVVDMFTAVQLLIFDRWSGKIKPKIDLSISRWVFLGCILASYVFLGYRFWRAYRAIKCGGIAQSYLDPLAVRLQSIRMGKNGRGYRRFLVFAEMTKGKKGVEVVALFTYFSFEAWYRIILAEGPRNVINAVTVYSVFQADLIPSSQYQNLNALMQFLTNVKVLADGDWVRAAVLIGMLFVLITWSIAFISLMLSCIFYVCYLWRHIGRTDKSLRSFCKRRVDARLSKIVDEKVDKALMKADQKRAKLDMKSGTSGENIADIRKAPTLPSLEPTPSDMLPPMPLGRQNTSTTLGTYASVPTTASRPDMLSRMDTSGSASSFRSYGSNAPLMSDAGAMGMGAPPRSYSPAPSTLGGPPRSFSPAPSGPMGPGGPPRAFSPAPSGPLGAGPPRTFSPAPSAGGPPRAFSPAPSAGGPPRSYTPAGRPTFHVGAPPSPLNRTNTGSSGPMSPPGPPGSMGRANTGLSNYSNQGRSSPAPGFRPPPQEFEMRSQTPQGIPPRAQTASPFQAYNPSIKSPTQRSFTAPQGQFPGQRPPPGRNFTSPTQGRPAPPGGFRGPPGPPGGPPSTYDSSIYDHY